MKMGDHKHSKLMEPNFLGKLSLAWKRAKRLKIAPQFVCFSISTAFFSGLTLFFWYFTWSWGTISTHSKLTEPSFFKKFSLVRNQAKNTQNGQIFMFLQQQLLQDWPSICFLYFAWSWGTISTQNSGSQVSGEKFYLAWKQAKMTQNALICLLVHYVNFFSWEWLISFFWYFVRSCGTISTWNWGSQIFWENSHLAKNVQKWLKIFVHQLLQHFSEDYLDGV